MGDSLLETEVRHIKMEDPPADRLPDTQEEQTELYVKDTGSAQIHGQNFEYKFCALVFLRARNQRQTFKLASNMEGLGAFDDVFLEYLDENSRKKHIFVQLKSKTKKRVTMEELLTKKGDFSLRKYYESYIQIEEKFNSSEELEGSTDESLFILYTNADVGKNLKSNKVTHISEVEFLMTGGTVLQFNEEEHKAIYEQLQDLPKYRKFFSRFRIFYEQTDERGMDRHIASELRQCKKLRDSELDIACMCFIDTMKEWWQHNNFFLKNTNCKENDPLLKTSEKITTILVAKMEHRKSELDELSIKYEQSAIKYMKKLTDPHRAVLIFAPGSSTTLTATKIHQMLSDTEHIIMNSQQLIRYKTEVMLAWKSRFDVLVLESQTSTENFQDVADEIYTILNKSGVEKKFIFISARGCNVQQLSALRRTFSTKLTEEYDDWKFADIAKGSRTFLLEKMVTFQGTELQIKNLVKESDFRMLNALDCESISLLLANEKPSIGTPTENTLEYYIDRTLESSTNVKSYIQNESEVKVPFREENLEEIQGTDVYMEETGECSYVQQGFQVKSTKVWRPSTLLDGEDRIILVTDDPGMGKSTLLTHLAKQTRELHNNIWIVMVIINNYTRILHGIKTNGFEEKVAIELLAEAAQIKETEGPELERQLFNYIYNSTGNMAVLIDGVDEVSPHYTNEVIQILRFLTKTEIKIIWVTSRNSVKEHLEQEFQCQSYSLTPFSVEDQKSFLVKFWNQQFSHINADYLENFAHRVVEISSKHLSDSEKKFMGIPLQSMLLAEMFEENLKQWSTSRMVELPENINCVMLYDSYVTKKWEIYLSEKKLSDQTNVNAVNDDKVLYGTFISNHKAAALMAILSTQHLEKLNEKNVQQKGLDFLQKIRQGLEKTGIITGIVEERPVFLHRTFGEYFVAGWLRDNISESKTFMRDHLLESGFDVVRSMVDRILADKDSLHEAMLNSNTRHVEEMLKRKSSINQKDSGGRTPLHVAVSCKSPELIRLLLENEADVSSVDTLLDLSPVEYALRMNDWEVLSLMMEERPEIREQVLNDNNKCCTDRNVSALRAAARYGRIDLLRCLLGRENSVNMVLPGDGGTLFHEAARGNHIHIVRTLVDLGANCDIQDTNGRTVLHMSAEMGSDEVTKFIVEMERDKPITKLNLLNIHDKGGNTPLHLAAAAGNTSTVCYLLSAGSDVRSCNTRGEYPLTLAARYGRNDTVKLLLQICTAPKREEILTSALTAAIVAGRVDTTALLLTTGAPVSGGENEKPIHIATRMGHKEIIRLLVEFGASLTSPTHSGNTALHLASETGHLSLVKYLVEIDRNGLNTLNSENETPLHLAARNGRDYLVTYFAESGCNINATSANGTTCLHVACENGHYTTVECLLKHGAKVNAVNCADQTPLHIAASMGQTEIVKLLFLHNANITLRDKDGITAVLASSINGNQDTLRSIVEHGGNIQDTDGKGNTVAHFAVKNENCDILNLLWQRNISLDTQNSDGDTPLLLAVREGRNRFVQYLAEKEYNINTQGKDGMRPLDVAVLKGNMEITRFLLEQNARSCKSDMHIVAAARFGFVDLLQRFVALGDDINVKADNGESPLHAACESGQVATVQYLCEYGAILDLQDNNSNTALHVAVSNGHLEVTRLLVEKGANLCAADESGSTALHIAAKGGYLNTVQYLADSFAPIDKKNAKNETALLVAAAEGHEKIVEVLIKQGAGIGVRDREGKTAFDVATEKGNSVITQLLKDRAEGRILVCSNSHNDIHTATEEDIFEHLQKLLNPVVPIDIETETSSTTQSMFETTPEGTLDMQSNHRCALHTAVENCNFEQVQRLVKAGIALDCGDRLGRTALWGAAKSGHKLIISYLLQNGSCVNIPDCEGVKPIDIAVRECHWGAVNELLKHVPEIRPEGTESLTNQLYEASESGELEVVRIILRRGISVNTTNIYGHTPLHEAAKSGHKEVTSLLLNCGANVNTANNDGKTPLILAATEGNIDVVREFLKHDANINTADYDGDTPLLNATYNGHVEVVRELLKQGANVNTANKSGLTPLFIASHNGHVEVVRELLKQGANINTADYDGDTPLLNATYNGHVEVVRELLKQGANVNSANESGLTPLFIASHNGQFEVVRELLKHGANINTVDYDGDTPLLNATYNGHVEVVRELLKQGANVNSANEIGLTPLFIASHNGQFEVVRELLKHGANINTVDYDGDTPLHLATYNGHVEVVRELLKHGANLNNADKNCSIPLHIALEKGHVEVVRELLKHGANINTADYDGDTPLHNATYNGHVEVVRELLKHGANVNNADKNCSIPLHIALEKGHVEVVRELLKQGANVNTANKSGLTPLFIASQNGHVVVVRELLKHGANVNNADKNCSIPLHMAVEKAHVEVVRELLKHGANVNTANKSGLTPLFKASQNGHVEVVRELLKHGANVNNADKNCSIPLHIAVQEGDIEVVRELLKHGANVNTAYSDTFTPLYRAVEKGHVEVVRELLKQGANVNTAGKDGTTPLLLASLCENIEIVRELLYNGAIVNTKDNEGRTPLYLAGAEGHIEEVREFLKRGANVNTADNDDDTPLHVAGRRGYCEVVRELLNRGANVNTKGKDGSTPLHLASQNGYVEVVRELLNQGANVNTANKIDFTPLYAAGMNSHFEVMRELLNNGAQVDKSKEAGQTFINLAAEKGYLDLINDVLK